MNRVGLKDYLLNNDSELLDCAKAWDRANKYGQFDTYGSVKEAAEANDWGAAQALSEAVRVDQGADNFRLNGYGHLESVSDACLLEYARDSTDDIVDWLDSANRYELEGISSDIELMVDAKDPFEIINEVDCSVRCRAGRIEVNLSRRCDEATLSFSKRDGIEADKDDLANVASVTAENYHMYADGHSTEEVQAKFREEHGRGLSAERADQLKATCEKNMDALKQVLDDDEIEALDKLYDVELCDKSYQVTLFDEAHKCKYIASACEKIGLDPESCRDIEKHAEIEAKQRVVFDAEQGDGTYSRVYDRLAKFFAHGWNPILVKGGSGRYDGPNGGITVYEAFENAVTASPSRHQNNIPVDCKIDRIWDENGSLFLTGTHHDGRTLVEMRQLTDEGLSLYEAFLDDRDLLILPWDGFETMGFVYREGDENAFVHDLWDNPEMCSKPRLAEKIGGFPTEEYIMEHDGVRTEFQIYEVKEDSFAYDQGAWFDVKVLTDGYDCGNGRFCADLDEAHEYCQQFADDIAGLGESLDDMCEDRSEVALAVQDIDSGERKQEDSNHDNSEIGE